MSTLSLSQADETMLHGDAGPATALAMRIVVGLARANGATRLIDISAAHIDGTIYIGPASLGYATRLRDLGGQVKVRTTLNVSSLDLLHPELYRGENDTRTNARATMQAYEDMGCIPTWTCAPYQLTERPAFGDRIAWAESNAIVFANSVLGARTDRFGDFIDIAAALTGRAPEAGLFLDVNRHAGVQYDVSGISARLRSTEEFFAVLGIVIGREVGREVPVVTGIETASEDQLKALGAAAATAGTVAMLHVVGVTPEAPTLAAATGGQTPRVVTVNNEMLKHARDSLSIENGSDRLRTVNLGTPHYSRTQIARLTTLLAGRPIHSNVTLYVNTGRDVLATVPDVPQLEDLGVVFVVDTCTYITPIIERTEGIAMSDSAKWAYYAPGNIGVEVMFGSTADCVEPAVRGSVTRDEDTWR